MQIHNLGQLDAAETAALLVLVIERVGQIGTPAIDEFVSLIRGAPDSDAFYDGVDLFYRWADNGGHDLPL